MSAKHLTAHELKGLLTSESAASIDELYTFGQMLLSECLDRSKQLDAKATSLSGYTGVIVALLVTTFASKLVGMRRAELYPLMVAGLCVIGAGGMAVWAIWIRGYQWFSDRDWFAPSVIQSPQRLKQFHVLAMHSYKHQHEAINADKAARLQVAYWLLATCVLMLMAALFAPKIVDISRPLLGHLFYSQ